MTTVFASAVLRLPARPARLRQLLSNGTSPSIDTAVATSPVVWERH